MSGPPSRPRFNLTDLRRVGPSLAGRLIEHFGSEAAALWALESADLGSLAEVDGVGSNLALSLARDYRRLAYKTSNGMAEGVEGEDSRFLATGEAVNLWERILEHIFEHALNGHVRNQLRLLEPLPANQWQVIEERRERFGQALNLLDHLTSDEACQLAGILANMTPIREPPARTGRERRVVVAASETAARRLQEVARHCRLYILGPGGDYKDYTDFGRVCWVGPGGPPRTLSGWERFDEDANLEVVVPEATLTWFSHNRATLEALGRLRALVGEIPDHPLMQKLGEGLDPDLSTLSERLDQVARGGLVAGDEQLATLARARKELSGRLGDVQLWVNQEIERQVGQASLTLEGQELLTAMQESHGGRLKGLIASEVGPILEEATLAGQSRLTGYLEPLGLALSGRIFTSDYPRELEPRTVRELEEALEEAYHRRLLDLSRRLAGELAPLREACRSGLSLALELGVDLTVARWAKTYGLTLPELAPEGITGMVLEGGRHLFLQREALGGGAKVEPVNYSLGAAGAPGDRQSVALLSGANSGGKTTLLELMAQVQALAQAGLPVPGSRVRLGLCQRLHLMAKASSTQSAGALERTLRHLTQVVCDPETKLLLADELEAITEPGAGAKIMAGLLEAASVNRANVVVMVSHLADQIMEATDLPLRVDGIAAVGLDEKLNLIVERSPRRNYLARSTPELIIRRLLEQTSGERRKVLERVMAKFQVPSE